MSFFGVRDIIYVIYPQKVQKNNNDVYITAHSTNVKAE